MTHEEAIARMLAEYPPLPERATCDGFKAGRADARCEGIAVSCALTINGIRAAAHAGANLILVHEPSFYTHADQTDWLKDNAVYRAKSDLLARHGIAVWRNHDHMHNARPDEIMQGVLAALQWSDYAMDDPDLRCPCRVALPPTTVREVAARLRDRMQLRTGRIVGNLDAMVSSVVFCGHIFPSWDARERDQTLLLSRDDVDLLIAFEMIDWTAAAYARDAAELGLNKAIIQPGHFVAEEPGMRWLAARLEKQFAGELPVFFIPSGDPYCFL